MNQRKTYSIIAIVAFLVTALGISFAYFIANYGPNASTNINVESRTTDKLSFIEGTPINITATQENFAEGMGNLSDYTKTSAKLIANTNTNSAAENYNVFFVIDYNDFEYTTEDEKIELLMKVTDPTGQEITSIPGLHYKTQGSLSGFDITTSYGSFGIAQDYLIESTNETIQDWRVDVIFINLDTSQKANENKSFSGQFFLTKDETVVYTLPMVNTIKTNVNNGISLDIEAEATKGTGEIDKYYFAIKEDSETISFKPNLKRLGINLLTDVTYIEKDVPNHTFTSLTPNTDYIVYAYTKDNNGFQSSIYETIIKTVEYNLPAVTNVEVIDITETSLKVNVTGKNGGGTITEYYYSSDNGNNYIQGTGASHTFTDLTPGTNYQIKVYVKDNNNFESTIYSIVGTTNYTKPTINSVTFSDVTASSFKINVSAAGGTNSIKTYFYSRDNGATYQSSASNAYTYSSLSANTTYNIKVYVMDTLNYQSSVIDSSIKTSTPTFAQTILANNGGTSAIAAKGNPNFSALAPTNEGMYKMIDDYGDSYYFRGAVNNNWVKFANMYWRIVRINGNGTVKLIYSGTTAPTSAQAVVMTGTGTQINGTTYQFNSNPDSAEYVGYMYTLGQQRGLGTSSPIKGTLESWYTTSLSSYDAKIADTIFCNDRSTYSGTLWGINHSGNGIGQVGTHFGAAGRLINTSSWAPIGTGPSLVCPHKSDAFTKTDTTKGNGQLAQKVGLLTADEASIAGLIASTGNGSNYLYTNSYYWLGSPSHFDTIIIYFAIEFYVSSTGNLNKIYVHYSNGVRPVISLSSDISVASGSGTWNSPYVIN